MSSKFLNKIKYLILPVALVSIFFLLIPDLAYAVLGTGIFDPFKKAILSLQQHFGIIVTFMIIVSIIWLIGLSLVSATTAILDNIIFRNPELVTVQSGMVIHGWDFVSGLANMLLILIFIALAFSLILKIESWEVKKILPRLIIVALLLNFSLVFIGMAIDISNIFYNTFLPPGERLFEVVMEPFWGTGAASFTAQWAVISAKAKAVAIPFMGPFVMYAYIAAVPLIILPAAMILIAQAIMFFMLNGILFLYVLIFGARVFIIQILAILSPLAFLCLILPQTKKYWDMWLKWFLGWLFVGIFLLFFLRLGSLIFGTFRIGFPLAIPFFTLGDYLVFYLFVFIYLAILIFIAKKTMPEFADAAIGVATGIVKAKVIGAIGGAVAGAALTKHVPKLGHMVEKWGERLEERGGKGSKIPGLAWAGKKVGATATILGRETAVQAELAEKQRMEKTEEKIKKETTAERMSTIKTGTMDGKIAALRAAIDERESEDVFRGDKEWKQISKDEVAEIYRKAKAKGIGLEKDIAAAFPHLHKEFGITAPEKIDDLVRRITGKPEIIKNMHPDAYRSSEIRQRILTEFDGRAIGEAVRSSKQAREEIENIFEGRIKEVGFREFAKENPSAAAYFANTAARGAGVRDIIHLPEEEAREILRAGASPPRPPDIPPTQRPPDIPPGWIPGQGGMLVPPPKKGK